MPNLASCHLAGNKLRFEVQPGQVIYVVFIYVYFLNAYIICMHNIDDMYIYIYIILYMYFEEIANQKLATTSRKAQVFVPQAQGPFGPKGAIRSKTCAWVSCPTG